MKIALDATPLLGPRTGVGEFCAQLLSRLALRPGLEVGAFAISRAGRSALAPVLPPGVTPRGRPGPGLPERALHMLWAQVSFPTAEMLFGPSDVVHGTNFVVPPARSPTVVTVHDLSPLHYPQWSDPAARAYPALVKKAVERGAFVHTDSHFVAGEVIELLGVPPARVRPVHLGVTLPISAREPPSPGTEGPERPSTVVETLKEVLPDWVNGYVLAMSRVDPRKDFAGLVRAFASMAGRHPGLALVLVGPAGTGSAQLDQELSSLASATAERVIKLGWVSEANRDALLEGATVFAYPSRYEGFGLPPLQAMAAGAPVVATRCGALEEVLGDDARLVAVGDQDALAGALDALVDDPEARRELSARGLVRAARFTWEACAEGLVALYQEAAAAARA